MTATTAETLSLNDASRLLGKKPDTLKKWFSLGCPHEREGKGYRVRIAAVFDWKVAREISLAQGGDGSSVISVEVQRAKLLQSQFDHQEMANATRRGELVEASGVLREWQSLISACRAKLLSLGDKLAARLPIPDNTRKKVAAAIRDGIAEALKEIANDRA